MRKEEEEEEIKKRKNMISKAAYKYVFIEIIFFIYFS
jgi:hypothetical protein